MPNFATYFHQEVCQGKKTYDQIPFVGYSVPYFNSLRESISAKVSQYPQLPLRKADLSDYLTVHEQEYLGKLVRMANDESVAEPPVLSAECRGLEYFLDAYLYSLGGFQEAIDQMKFGVLERAYIFSLGSHHAHAARGHGYCLLNSLAAAVRYAQGQGFQKIVIVDWDSHHGDGTQSIFENDRDVYQISIHNLLELYMGMQRVWLLGTTSYGHAVGHCNIPLLPEIYAPGILDKMSLETDYYRGEQSISVFREALGGLHFSPDMIFIFSGYDSHKDDCGGDVTGWDFDEFRLLTDFVLDKSKLWNCPVISIQGGGYEPDITIQAAELHINILANY